VDIAYLLLAGAQENGSGSLLKKNQKTFIRLTSAPGQPQNEVDKSFCFFFQKEALAFLNTRLTRTLSPALRP
jgi:hypothetical protein